MPWRYFLVIRIAIYNENPRVRVISEAWPENGSIARFHSAKAKTTIRSSELHQRHPAMIRVGHIASEFVLESFVSLTNVPDDQSPLASGVPPAREAGSAGGMTEVPKGW